ncbi:MAG: GtrA family protein [Planctomycetes bacterium]|nr:GtrA family protein [Planctomycetota bacterium]
MPRSAVNWSEVSETGKQLRRFLVVGVLSVLVDLAAYSALRNGLSAGTNLAKAISYLAGVVVGFVLNKRWTFESARKNWAEPASYLALYAVTLGVNVACNYAVLKLLGMDHWLIAYLAATGVTTVLNFLGMRAVTFRRGIADRREAHAVSTERVRLTRRKAG